MSRLTKLYNPFFFAIACLCSCSLFGQTAQQLQNTQEDFTNVASEAIPAVVTIQVKSSPKTKSFSSGGDGSYDPFELFGDDFFGHFFGMPRKGEGSSSQQVSQGSGFLISSDGLILTNNHVVRESGNLIVTLNDGREFPAKVIGQDSSTDLALIKIDAKDLPFLKLGNSENLKIGQWVVAIGNTLGLQASLTVGVVSAKGRSNLDIARIEDFIQTDAAINRGNSGGPLLNLKGEVVGINTAIATNYGNSGYIGIGFAIPSNMAKHVVEQIEETGSVSRGFLGIILQPVDSDMAQIFDLKKAEGALVAEVTSGSPAAEAGIKQGDVILKFNSSLIDSVGSLRNSVALEKPGAKINLTILRDKNTLIIPVVIGQFPDERTPPLEEPAKNNFGFDVKTLTPDIASSLNLSPSDSGVVVSKVDPNTPASLVGLKKGALILSINQQPVANREEFYKQLKATPSGKPVLFLIKQGSMTRFVSLKVE